MSDGFDPYHKWLGISPEEQPPNHYRLLGIKLFEKDPDVIQTAADQRSMLLHAHQTGQYSEQSQELLNAVAAARVCLLDPAKKAHYDSRIRRRLQALAKARLERLPKANPIVEKREERTPALVLPFTKRASRSRMLRRRRPQWQMPVALGAGLVAIVVLVWLVASQRHASRTSPSASEVPKNTGSLPRVEQSNTRSVPPPLGKRPRPKLKIKEDPKEADDIEHPVRPAESLEGESQPSPSASGQPQKLPVPPESIQQRITEHLDDLSESVKYQTAAAKLDLARKLIQLAARAESNDEKYVALHKAMELACAGGDGALMIETVDDLAAEFDVDAPDLTIDTFTRLAENARDPAAIQSLGESAAHVINQALKQDQYELAGRVSELVYQFCSHSPGREFRKWACGLRVEVSRRCEAWTAFRDAVARLEPCPDDAEASRIVGCWYCLHKADWDEGLPYLARGDDAELAALARRELDSPPGTWSERVELADAWWDLGEARKGEARRPLMLHAGTWYQAALPEAQKSVLNAKIQSRLKAIAELDEPLSDIPPPYRDFRLARPK